VRKPDNVVRVHRSDPCCAGPDSAEGPYRAGPRVEGPRSAAFQSEGPQGEGLLGPRVCSCVPNICQVSSVHDRLPFRFTNFTLNKS